MEILRDAFWLYEQNKQKMTLNVVNFSEQIIQNVQHLFYLIIDCGLYHGGITWSYEELNSLVQNLGNLVVCLIFIHFIHIYPEQL